MKTQTIKEAKLLGREIKIYGSVEKPLFLARDVANWLGISNPRDMITPLDDEEKGLVSTDTPGGIQQVSAITEDGLYEVIMQSRKPIAKEFKKGIKQMLREMRQYGFTASEHTLDELISNPDLLIGLATELKVERARAELAESRVALASETIRKQAPKVIYHDEVLISQSTYTTTTIAKELGMGAPSLHKELNRRGIMYKIDGHWVLYHQYQGKGYTKTRTATYDDRKGETQSTITTVWTEKGREWLHKKLNPELTKTT